MAYSHIPHPWASRRKEHGPPKVADAFETGINGQIAVVITRGFGSMWAFWVLVVWMLAWMILASLGIWLFGQDRYPFVFLLFLSNLVQLWALPVLAVGQQVLGRSADKRAETTFKDAEAILAECLELQKHLQAQDEVMDRLIARQGETHGA